jgi:UDP-N-acetylglucosamine--N-acetylmuramyl-(pentapeptide) pyrophosphoryl-undecaprenol N-acetylglucosamine transferase
MEKTTKKSKIFLVGGGTGGSVSPLLAVAEELKKSGKCEFLFIGSKNGPERGMVAAAGLPFRSVAAGKLRRYLDWRNIVDLFKIKLAFWQSLFLLLKERPSAVLSAGSFVAVPMVFASWVLRIPCLVHQMDLRPGLANRLMAPFAKIITVTFEKSLDDYGAKAVWTGNPHPIIDHESLIMDHQSIIKEFSLRVGLPVVMVIGGGTGAQAINDLIKESIGELSSFCQVVHSTGKGKAIEIKNEDYHGYEFLDQGALFKVLSVADLVVTRAGIGTLTDLAAFKKPAIIIPMPKSHQEDNAEYFAIKGAGLFLRQNGLSRKKLVEAIKDVLTDDEGMKERMAENIAKIMPGNASRRLAGLVEEIFLSS